MNVPKLRFKEFTDEWKTHKLKDLCSINPKTPNITDKFYYIDLECVHNGKLKYIQCINKADAPSRAQRVLSPKDIIFQSVRAYQKNSYFFKKENDMQTIASTGYAQLRTKKDNPVYIYHYLYFQKFIDKVNKLSTGTSYPAINSSDLGIININVPTFTEQTKIANFLSTVDKKISNLEDIITNLENQKKGLLQQIFSQKLRFKDENGNNYPDWEKKKLEDIAIFLDNKRKPLEQSERIHGKYPYYGASGIIDYINDYIFDEELVLLSEDGANIIDRNYPICYIATGKYWVNNHAHVLKVKSQYVNKFICESLEQLNYTKYNTGTAQPKLNQDVCRKIILSIPCLEEQTKIANFLSTFDRKLENQKAQLEHWKQIKKGLLQQMFV